MNDKVIIQDKFYDIVRAEGVNVILRDQDGNEFASNAGGILLNMYIKEVLNDLSSFENVDNMRTLISDVHLYMQKNEAYVKLHSLLPMLILPENVVEAKVDELCDEYMRLYPSVIEPVAPKYIEPIEAKIPVDDVIDEIQFIVPEDEEVAESDVFTIVRDVNPMLINHNQKIMRSYLMDRYPEYEVNEEFTLVRNPRNLDEMYNIFINDSGETQMISTKRNIKEEIANTPALSEAQIMELENMSINELREERKKTSNLLKVNKINEIIAARKTGSEFDETIVVDQDFFNKLKFKQANALGFISNLTISFLVGVLGGIVLMILANLAVTLL